MTLFDFFSVLALGLSGLALVLGWLNEFSLRSDIVALNRKHDALYAAGADGFQAVDESLNRLRNAVGDALDTIDEVLGNHADALDDHEASLDGAAADMVATQNSSVSLFNYIQAVHLLAKSTAEQLKPKAWDAGAPKWPKFDVSPIRYTYHIDNVFPGQQS
jgi:hypothetical protein